MRAVGTTTNIFHDFCNYVCGDIETNNIPGTDFHWVFIWDNLTAHHSAYVHNTVTGRVGPTNFSIVPRPPYHPKYSPIEYKICKVMGKIWLKKEEDWDMNRLEHEIMLAIKIKSYLSIQRLSTAGIDGVKLTIYVIRAMIHKVVGNY